MSSPVIKVENLSKQYQLGVVGTGTFSHDIERRKMKDKISKKAKVKRKE